MVKGSVITMNEYKCKHCKKCYEEQLEGYYCCKVTSQLRPHRCTNVLHPQCQSFELNWLGRLVEWFDKITD